MSGRRSRGGRARPTANARGKAASRYRQERLGSVIQPAPGAPKRSRHLRLALMAGAVGIPLAVVLWPEPETGVVLASESDCSRPLKVTQEACETVYAAARAQHEQVAPRFESATQCEQQFGACEYRPGSGAYIPAMGGFLVGYALAGHQGTRDRARNQESESSGSSGGAGGAYRVQGALPLYRERGGRWLNPGGVEVADRAGSTVRGGRGNVSPPARAITVSRAGFGSSFGARSSFGG